MADKTLVYVGAEANGLYRKEAGDSNWQQLTEGMPPSPQARTIAIHPQDPNVVFVGTQRGVYRSQDRGDHWQRMNLTEGRIVWSLKFAPNDPQVMFLGTEGSEVFKSQDGGENWEYLSTISNPDSVQMAFATRILGIGIETSNPDYMYAALEVGGAARSTDGGRNWELVNGNFAGDVDLMDLHGVAVGSSDSSNVFISNRTGIWRTRDRGENWEDLRLGQFSDIRYSRGIQAAPNDPNTLYACVGLDFGSEAGGVLQTTDLGETWRRFDQGVTPHSTTFGVAINAQQPEQVYFCTRRGEVFGTHDGGQSWQTHTLPETATNVISVACSSA
ncbi:MAG: WD40/YVTN/BNR-like repeat-containing protein [Dehalococcoidia bacterium]